MKTYVESTLMPGERIVYQGRLSLWFLSGYFFAGLILLSTAGIGLVFWLLALIRYFTTEIAVTDRRVVAKVGFISRATIEIGLRKTESIQVKQSILGRLFDFGSIVISGAGNPQAPIHGISDPLAFRRAFLAAQDPANASSAAVA